MFSLRHPQNKAKATKREIQTNHVFSEKIRSKARKNPWMTNDKIPQCCFIIPYTPPSTLKPKMVFKMSFLCVLGWWFFRFQLFFGQQWTFCSPRNVMWLHVSMFFGVVLNQESTISSHFFKGMNGWALKRCWHGLPFPENSATFPLEQTHCTSLSHRFYGYDGLWV